MNMFRSLWNQVRLTWRLVRDPRIPLWMKAIPFAAVVYVISPLDLLPDIVIGLGQLDDLGIVLAGMQVFERVVPGYIVDEHKRAMVSGGSQPEIVDAPSYRISRPERERERS